MCTILSFDLNHEKNFDNKNLRLLVISWFNIFLATPKIEFLGDLNVYLRELIKLLGDTTTNSEVYHSLEKCLKDIRTRFLASDYINGKKFCIELLSSLTDLCKDSPTKIKQLESFIWIFEILKHQLNSMNLQSLMA